MIDTYPFNVQPNPCIEISPYILLFRFQHLLHGYDAGLPIIFEFQVYFHELLYTWTVSLLTTTDSPCSSIIIAFCFILRNGFFERVLHPDQLVKGTFKNFRGIAVSPY